MLEVRDRVHADRVRDLPGCLGQFLDGRHRVAIERRAAIRLHDEEEVVVLRVGVLQFLEGLQLGVGLREEHAVVGGELEPCCARANQHGYQHRAQQHDAAVANNASCECRREAVDGSEIVTHWIFSVCVCRF